MLIGGVQCLIFWTAVLVASLGLLAFAIAMSVLLSCSPHILMPYSILLTCSYKVPESGIDVEAPLPAWATGGSPVAV